ncbi:MobF family relaxase [Mastigocoleus testarum]|uniref:TrwC relaxase domain-containing protein n=1 Tax=Mastigocoleus testarum BC008 TaxID=371196 RepID=A0A0V7ZCX9_9CYAN|nr:MobF family relaxase [Mastigocoleus testarum]KST62236.1 hypothetical protein BC008_08680 [Mastigocoleus testarum BC008]
MLTAKNVSAIRASDYFLKGHSLQGDSRWHGKGAHILGLKDKINNQRLFKNICDGISPDATKKLSARFLKSTNRRAATDFTFSAPKSVSLMALVGGDERIIKAHQLAVEKTLDLIEERYACARVTINGERQIINTGNLVVAEFDHIESREQDPHLHTHALVMNITKLPDSEQWYSNFNDQIFANKKFLGMHYQNCLSQEIQKLGYSVEPLEHGQFEISGFDPQHLEFFSKRQQQILTRLGDYYTREEKEKVWGSTRKSKKDVHQEDLKARWKTDADELKITFPKSKPSDDIAIPSTTEQDLKQAVDDCSERRNTFTQEDIEKNILTKTPSKNISQVPKLIKSNNNLICISEQHRKFTTQTGVQQELTAIKLMLSRQNKVRKINNRKVEKHLERNHITQNQKQALASTFQTTDQFIAWKNIRGKRKSSSLLEFKKIAAKIGFQVTAFAPNSRERKELSQNLGIKANTINSLKGNKYQEFGQSRQFWVVSAAHLLSSSDIISLFENAIEQKARVLLIGNNKKVSQISFTDNTFKSLQSVGLKTISLNQPSRLNSQSKITPDITQNKIQELEKLLTINPNTSQASKTTNIEKESLIHTQYNSQTFKSTDNAQNKTQDFEGISNIDFNTVITSNTSKINEENLIHTQYDADFLKSIAENIEEIISTALEDIGVLDNNNQVFETNPFTFYKQEDTFSIQRNSDSIEIFKNGEFTPDTTLEDFENIQEFTLIAMEHIEESQSENLNRGMRR